MDLQGAEGRDGAGGLNEWSKQTLGESAGFWRDLAQDPKAVSELLDKALSSARTHCHTVKLSVLSDHLNQLSNGIPNVQSVPQVQHFRETIDNRLKSHPALESDWSDFTNQTSQVLSRDWSELQQALQQGSPGLKDLSNADLIAKNITSGFASSWDDIIQFIQENAEAHIRNIEQMITDHPVLFKTIAILAIAGGSLLIGPSVILALLQLFGFSAIGPIAGSPAAIWQSIHFGATVPKGSLWSLMQKIAMGGLVASTFVELLIGCSLIAMGGYIIKVLWDGRVETSGGE